MESIEQYLENGELIPEEVTGVDAEFVRAWNDLVKECRAKGLALSIDTFNMEDDLNPDVIEWVKSNLDKIKHSLDVMEKINEDGWSKIIDTFTIHSLHDVEEVLLVLKAYNEQVVVYRQEAFGGEDKTYNDYPAFLFIEKA